MYKSEYDELCHLIKMHNCLFYKQLKLVKGFIFIYELWSKPQELRLYLFNIKAC